MFQTPELQYTSPDAIGPAADVYNVVLLLFMVSMNTYRLDTSLDFTSLCAIQTFNLHTGTSREVNVSLVGDHYDIDFFYPFNRKLCLYLVC